MKKIIILTTAIVAVAFYSCKKDTTTTTNNNNNNNTSKVTVMAKDSSTQAGNPSATKVRQYLYNSSNKLVKIKYKDTTSTTYGSYDTIIYNANGQIATINNYYAIYSNNSILAYTLNGTTTYSYTSGNLTSIVGPSDTLTLVYTNGKISTIYEAKQGSSGRDTITNIVYTGNNASSLTYSGTAVTATIDLTAANPYYGYFCITGDFSDLIEQNNLTKADATLSPTTILTTRSYTYANGMVATKTETNQGSSYITITVITYESI